MYEWLYNQYGMYLAPDDQEGEAGSVTAGGTDKEEAGQTGTDPLRQFFADRGVDFEKAEPLKMLQTLWEESQQYKAVGREKAERQKRQQLENKLSNFDLDTLLGDEKVSPTLKDQILTLGRGAEKSSSLLQTFDLLAESGVIPSELLDVIKEGPAATRAALAFMNRQKQTGPSADELLENKDAMAQLVSKLLAQNGKVAADLGQAKPTTETGKKPVSVLQELRGPQSITGAAIEMWKEGAKKK